MIARTHIPIGVVVADDWVYSCMNADTNLIGFAGAGITSLAKKRARPILESLFLEN